MADLATVKRNILNFVPNNDPTRQDLQGISVQLIELIEQQEARIAALEANDGK